MHVSHGSCLQVGHDTHVVVMVAGQATLARSFAVVNPYTTQVR